MKRSSLQELQTKRLRDTIDYASRQVPFYMKLYETAGVDADEIESTKDIAKFPTIGKKELRAVPLLERTARDIELKECRLHTTSGSFPTGTKMTVLDDPYSAAVHDALNLRFLWAYGVRPLDKLVRLRQGSEDAYDQLKMPPADRPGLWAFARSKWTHQLTYDTDLNEHLELLRKWNADVLMAATPYCKALARLTETTGKNLSFKIVVTSGVLLDDSTRKYIRDKFNAEVYDHYGTMETGGSLAWECPSHSGYHLNAETSLFEFIRNGRPVSSGEPGEVHVTSFCRLASPVIRYSVGDIAVPLDDECCCGRQLPLIREIQGRSADYIVTIGSRYISPFTVVRYLNSANNVDQFKVTQLEDRSIEVCIVTHQNDSQSVTEQVERSCRNLFGDTPIEVHVVEKIENSESRKFRAIESRLAQLK